MTEPDAVVAAWSHDWRSALPVRSTDEQAALLADTRRVVASLQEAARAGGRAGHALHRKTILESADATFDVSAGVPSALRAGPFSPGASWPVTVRLSSAFPLARSDEVPDQRGLGVHLADGDRRVDLLATTGEAHHARDARAMLASLGAAASAARGGVSGRLGALAILVRAIGLPDGLRLLRTVSRAAQAGVSVASLTFFSRAPFQLGPYAVRYRFAPLGSADATVHGAGSDALAADLRQRLATAPLRWSFELQGYRDPASTPMDDHRVAWRSAWVGIATLTVRSAATLPVPLALRAAPSWPSDRGAVLEPLGDLNMLRGVAYEASQSGRRESH